ncbi:MAG: hypothetical protein NT049_04655, partial [Planctomycetota bacterium]|nr:hypothetical protein [Planctomycetota bacterium]
MCAEENPDNLSALFKTGYDAPPPREEFVRDLGLRLRKELSEQHAAPAAPQPRRVSALRWSWAAAAAVVVLLIAGGITWTLTHPGGGPQISTTGGGISPPEPSGTPQEQMVPLEIQLPKAVAGPTPKNIKASPYLEPYNEKPRPVFRVPEGTTNVALGKPVTSSEPVPVIGEPKQATDGDKEGADGSYVDLGNNTQWIQIDLKEPYAIFAIVLWHYHGEKRVYHDVVIQVADDPDVIENVRTVFNNDFDNSSGLGIGKDLEYIEDYRGRLIDGTVFDSSYDRG